MLGYEEFYEPDDILRDVDTEDESRQEEEIQELSFETGREAAEGMSLLIDDVESPEELFELS